MPANAAYMVDKEPGIPLDGLESSEQDDIPPPARERLSRKRIHHALLGLTVLVIVVLTVVLAIVLSPKKSSLSDASNIVIVIADDLGYNDVGYNNVFNDIQTPYIDKLASQSIKLERFYVQPMCSPSRAGLFTGRYPFRYGMGGARAMYYGTKEGLPKEEKLLPEFFKDVGYETYLVGKWHLGFASWAHTPVERGFQEFFGMYGGSVTHFTHQSYEGPQEPVYDFFEDKMSEDGLKHEVVIDKNNTFDELLLTQKAVDVISKHKGDVPMFLVVSYTSPHAPIETLPQDLAQNSHIKNKQRRKMAGMITGLDYGIGRIHSALIEKGVNNNTIFVFMSDNGAQVMQFNGESLGGSNFPYKGAKTNYYEGGIRVPSFIRIPSYEGKSVQYKGLFHITDWFPTLISLVNVITISEEIKEKLDGIDHADAFYDILMDEYNGSEPRTELIIDIDPVYNFAGIIRGNYKYMIGNTAPLGFEKTYGPLKENETHYPSNETEVFELVNKNDRIFKDYLANESKCLDVKCIPSYDMELYDLRIDPNETHNIAWRFTDNTEDLQNRLLEVTSEEPLAVPLYMQQREAESIVYNKELQGKVWKPWLN